MLRLTFFLRFMPSRRKAAQVVGDFARVARTPRTPAVQPVSHPDTAVEPAAS